jgi:hypothetical protein
MLTRIHMLSAFEIKKKESLHVLIDVWSSCEARNLFYCVYKFLYVNTRCILVHLLSVYPTRRNLFESGSTDPELYKIKANFLVFLQQYQRN